MCKISASAKSQQKILNSMLVRARQSFQFLDKKPGFLEIIEIKVYLNLGIGFCTTKILLLLVLPSYKNIGP